MTTIKAVYGEVSYARRVYQTNLEDGRKACVYLPDEAMHMDKIGLLSTNLAEIIAMTVTESPYRVQQRSSAKPAARASAMEAHGTWYRGLASGSVRKKTMP